MDAAASKYRQPIDEGELKRNELAYAREHANTGRLEPARLPKTPSERALMLRFRAAMARATRELDLTKSQPSRATRRAVDAIARKCMRVGLLQHRKQPEDPADG